MTDEQAVLNRLALYNDDRTPSSSFPLSLPSPENTDGTTGSLREILTRLHSAERSCYDDYIRAIKEEPSAAPKCLRAWNALLEQIRKIEAETPSVEKENKDSIPKQEIVVELSEMFRNLRQDLESLPRRISLHSGKSKYDLEKVVTGEVERIIDSLFSSKYLREGSTTNL